MMKTSSEAERLKSPIQTQWEKLAVDMRKPIECAFAILKNKFRTIQTVVRLLHKNEIVRLDQSCLVFHNRFIYLHDYDYYSENTYYGLNHTEDFIFTVQTPAWKRQRDDFIYYFTTF